MLLPNCAAEQRVARAGRSGEAAPFHGGPSDPRVTSPRKDRVLQSSGEGGEKKSHRGVCQASDLYAALNAHLQSLVRRSLAGNFVVNEITSGEFRPEFL